MAKVTIVKNSDYTVVTNSILRNNKLGMKEMGLLIWMLSKPSTWDYTISGIVAARGGRESRDKKSAIRAALKQLENAGYLKRERVRMADGRLGAIEYTLYEVPQQQQPGSDFPTLENPTLENQTQLNKDISKYRKGLLHVM